MSCSRIYYFIRLILDYCVLGLNVANTAHPGTQVKGTVLVGRELGPIQMQRSCTTNKTI